MVITYTYLCITERTIFFINGSNWELLIIYYIIWYHKSHSYSMNGTKFYFKWKFIIFAKPCVTIREIDFLTHITEGYSTYNSKPIVGQLPNGEWRKWQQCLSPIQLFSIFILRSEIQMSGRSFVLHFTNLKDNVVLHKWL